MEKQNEREARGRDTSMVGSITREMFQAEAARLAAGFAGEAWDEVV